MDAMTSDAFAELENLLKLGPRESATNQESVAARYLQEKVQDLGYDTEIQEFTVSDLELKGLGLTVNTSQQVEFVALPMIESGLVARLENSLGWTGDAWGYTGIGS